MNTQLASGINWVGYVDWTVRDFHSYNTVRGATYNAYLVQDEKTALLDTVKTPYYEELLKNISRHCALADVDYVVCNHAEPDHAGALGAVLARLPNATVVCDAKCREILSAYQDTSEWRFKLVKSGETLSLGRREFVFVETPLVHWPESMMTYLPAEKILFSMDGFGQHYATSERFDDEVDLDVALEEARIYYANIVQPYGAQVARTLKAAGELDIAMLAPSHGVIWRRHLGAILERYSRWAAGLPDNKVVIIYDSMWQSTEKIAREIYHGALTKGGHVKLLAARVVGNTQIAADVFDAAAVAWGSATLNQTMMPAIAGALCYAEGLRAYNKAGMIFGSHGWGRGALEEMAPWLERMKYEVVAEPIKCKWRPDQKTLAAAYAAGEALGAAAAARAK